MKALLILLLTISTCFATNLRLSYVKQVVYLHGGDEDDGMRIVDVPFVTYYSDPEWRFSAISSPFIAASDGSWKKPHDINLASLYGISVMGIYKDNNKDVMVTIDLAKAVVPEGYPFTLEEVTEQIKQCAILMYPYDAKIDSKLEFAIVHPKLIAPHSQCNVPLTPQP